MELTGIAGQIVGWAVLITGYTGVILGLFFIWNYLIIEILLKRILIWMKVYDRFARFIWDYSRIKAKQDKQDKNDKESYS